MTDTAPIMPTGYKFVKTIVKDELFLISRKGVKYSMRKFSNEKDYQDEVRYIKLLSNKDITMKMSYHSDKLLIIVVPKLTSLVDQSGEFTTDMDDLFINTLEGHISLMHHKYGIGHGDLNGFNIVYDSNKKPYIVNFSRAYDIQNHDWKTEEWMRSGFEWDISYKDFVNYDYRNWRRNSKDEIPRDHVSIEEEYYVRRFFLKASNYHIGEKSETLVFVLKDLMGGTVYALYRNGTPLHYVLKLEGEYLVDGTGIHFDKNTALKVFDTMFPSDGDWVLTLKEVVLKTPKHISDDLLIEAKGIIELVKIHQKSK